MIFFDKDEGGAGTTPTRDQVPAGDTWDLSQLYATPADWQAGFEKVQRDYAVAAQWKGRVAESVPTLRAVLEFEKAT